MSSQITVEDHLGRVVKLMYEYQEKNGITKKCVTNSQYLRDCIAHTKRWVRIAPVFAVTEIGQISVHMVILILDKDFPEPEVIDPSYEFVTKTVLYAKTVDELKKKVGLPKDMSTLRPFFQEFLEFVELARKQNDGDVFVEKEYYIAQADYVESNYVEGKIHQ